MKKLFLIICILILPIHSYSQWQQCIGIFGGSINALDKTSSNSILAGTDANGIYRSTDNGNTWMATSLSSQKINCFYVEGNKIYAGTGTNSIYLSTNDGINWNHINIEYAPSVYSIYTIGNIILVGSGSPNDDVFISTDNGVNWDNRINNVGITRFVKFNSSILVSCSGSMYNDTSVYLSNNNGVNWNSLGWTDESVLSITVAGNYIFTGTYYHGVFISINSGSTWAQTALYNRKVWALTSSGNSVFAGLDTGGVYSTTNSGTSWVNKNQGFSQIPTVKSLLVANNYLFAGTQYNSVWRRPLTQMISVQNISTEIPSKYSLSQNYPNPFNSMCNVQFSMSNAGNAKLVVYDVQGREVQTLVNESLKPGTYEVSFDASNLSSGIYFYKLITNGFTQTKKMLMIK